MNSTRGLPRRCLSTISSLTSVRNGSHANPNTPSHWPTAIPCSVRNSFDKRSSTRSAFEPSPSAIFVPTTPALLRCTDPCQGGEATVLEAQNALRCLHDLSAPIEKVAARLGSSYATLVTMRERSLCHMLLDAHGATPFPESRSQTMHRQSATVLVLPRRRIGSLSALQTHLAHKHAQRHVRQRSCAARTQKNHALTCSGERTHCLQNSQHLPSQRDAMRAPPSMFAAGVHTCLTSSISA